MMPTIHANILYKIDSIKKTKRIPIKKMYDKSRKKMHTQFKEGVQLTNIVVQALYVYVTINVNIVHYLIIRFIKVSLT